MSKGAALWTLTTLGAACKVNPPKPKLSGWPDDTTVLFVPMAAVDEVTGEVTATEHHTLAQVRTKSYRTFASEDVIFAKITPCMENGKSAIVPNISSDLGFGSTEFHVLRPNDGVNPRFIWHYVRQESFRGVAEAHMTGSVGQLRVPADFLRDFPIRLPPEATQDEIVRVLDSGIGSARSAIEHLAAARRGIERFRQVVLAAACSGRLTADWRDTHGDAGTVKRALTEVPSKKRGRPSDDDLSDLPLPDLPDTYIVSTVGGASVALQYGTSKRADTGNAGVPVLRMGNIQDGRLELDDLKYIPTDREIERLILENGDLLFNRTNSPELVGKSAVFHETAQMTFASYLIRVRFAADVAEPDFVNFWINSAWGKAWARQVKTDGVSQSNINGTKLGAMPLPLPPIEEQREIVRRASRMLERADGLLARIELASRRVDQTSQAVLAKAFRGDLLLPLGAGVSSVSKGA